jgi:hypothetical protein
MSKNYMKSNILKFLNLKNIFYLFLFLSANIQYSCKNPNEVIGEQIIQKIDNYAEINNKLPEGLNDLGVEEKKEGPIYYLKKNSKSYIIWYELPSGKSKVYDSSIRNWN